MGNVYHQKKKTNLFTVAFYNLENLFDTKDNPKTRDDDFLPDSEKRWNKKRYQRKIHKLGTTISNIGFLRSGKAPALIGIAEVENLQVVQDLIASRHLKNKAYGIVHYNAPDERGIDVALLYKKEFFELLDSKPVELLLKAQNGKRDYTRDILWVTGLLNTEKIHILVNHWPSRRDGAHLTEYKRVAAAQKNREIIAEIRSKEPEAKIIVMGDFNDNPTNASIKEHLVQQDFFNPMEQLLTRSEGSLSYRSTWNLFDQVIFSTNFHKYEKQQHSFSTAKIFDRDFLKIYKGRHRGTPFRTYTGRKYKGGYSDHFPVYIQLQYNENKEG